MTRSYRHSKILEIIANNEIETQEELALALRNNGCEVTQATVSRDIKELGLLKALSGSKYKYIYAKREEKKLSTKLSNIYREAVLSFTPSENIIVIKTLDGCARAVANAVDKLEHKDILGCVAGFDTVIVVVKDKTAVQDAINTFYKLTE